MGSFAVIAALNNIIEYCGMRTQKGAGKFVSRVFGVNSEFASAIRGFVPYWGGVKKRRRSIAQSLRHSASLIHFMVSFAAILCNIQRKK